MSKYTAPINDMKFVLNELAMTGRIRLTEQPYNQGQSAARNRALDMARYDYIFPLDADDKMNPQEPGFFDDAVSRLERHPETIAVYSRLKYFGARHVPFLLPGYTERMLLLQNMIPVCGLYRRDDALRIGGYKEDLRYSEDWEMWNRIAANYPTAYTPLKLASYRVHSNNITGNALKTGQNLKDISTVIDIIQSDNISSICNACSRRESRCPVNTTI